MKNRDTPGRIINSASRFIADIFRKAQQIDENEVKSIERLQNSEVQKRIDAIRESIHNRSRAEK